MLTSEQRLVQVVERDVRALDPAVRSLLDHVAAELAAEYVRLMEAAAKAEAHEPETCLKETER
jgi:hypothetical protein